MSRDHKIKDIHFLDVSVQWKDWINEKTIFYSLDETKLKHTL